MNSLEKLLSELSVSSISILDAEIPFESYTKLDLSVANTDLENIEITEPDDCQKYIDSILKQNKALVAYGGYLEKRGLYADKSNFSSNSKALRNIHLGIDYWTKAGTSVLAPLDGVIHSFNNNNTIGDYGPTIILSHTIAGLSFYTLYGHLSIASIDGLKIGDRVFKDSIIGYLGTPDINVNYAPHLHFQIIKDLDGYFGDYPGVCTLEDLKYYTDNCPNPNLLIKI
tara:strand:+ start:333 stop:1013 length:681 start_codon:yes stop_codon:yes gene_type:complete